MNVINQSYEQLAEQVADLRGSLEEANETLQAIRLGEVDAVVVQGSQGDHSSHSKAPMNRIGCWSRR
jgi:two-component system, OmpR family, phosphate regulon sensor histidine kinase PhoR